MLVRNLKYLSYELSRRLEARLWYSHVHYNHHDRRFELFFGGFGKRCDKPLEIYVSHAHNTWKDSSMTVQLVLNDEVLDSVVIYPGEKFPEHWFESLCSTLGLIRDSDIL